MKQVTPRPLGRGKFTQTQQDWYAEHSNERLKHWQAGYVGGDTFSIPYTIATYDDVVVHYNWNDERMFGIEIHNPAVAQVQRQLFELLWKQTEAVDDLVGFKQR